MKPNCRRFAFVEQRTLPRPRLECVVAHTKPHTKTYGFAPPQPADGAFDNRAQYEAAWNSKRVGVAWRRSLSEGEWIRLDAPVLQPRPGHWDAAITSNPAARIHPNGTTLLVYKSLRLRYPERHLANASDGNVFHLGAALAPLPWGPYTRLHEHSPAMLGPDGAPLAAEDPYIWQCGATGRLHLLFKYMGDRGLPSADALDRRRPWQERPSYARPPGRQPKIWKSYLVRGRAARRGKGVAG